MGNTGIGFMRFTNSADYTDPDRFAAVKRDLELYAESVHRILQTVPGERPREPKFGCDLRRLIFEPNEFYLQRAADFLIRAALRRWEPRLEVSKLECENDLDNYRLTAKLWLKVKKTGRTFSLTEEVNYANAA